MQELIQYNVDNQIAVMTINRPEALNALNGAVLEALERRIDEVAAEMGAAVLGKMPVDPVLTELTEAGEFAKAQNTYLEKAFPVLQLLDVRKKD